MASDLIRPLARGLALLEAFEATDVWLGNLEIAARTGLPAPTANRLAKSLVSLGYLEHSAKSRRYRLSPSVLSLGYAAVANTSVREIARGRMQKFADQTNLFITLGERDRLDIILIESCSGRSSLLALKLDAGSRIPIPSTPLGCALVWKLPPTERDYLLAHLERRNKADWPAMSRAIRQCFQDLDRLGFCVSSGVSRAEIVTVATPVVPTNGLPIMAVGCAAPGPFLPRKRIVEEVGPRLLAEAGELNLQLCNAIQRG